MLGIWGNWESTDTENPADDAGGATVMSSADGPLCDAVDSRPHRDHAAARSQNSIRNDSWRRRGACAETDWPKNGELMLPT